MSAGCSALPFVIPTEAKRSGGICSSTDPFWKCFSNPLNLRLSSPGAGLQHLLRMPQRSLGQFSPAKHPRHFLSPLLIIKQPDRSLSSPLPLTLLHQKMLIGERRNLGQMCNAKHLLCARQLLQLLPDRIRRPPANTNVNFVKHQSAGNRRLPPSSSLPASRPFLDTDLKRQHHARQL